VDYQALYNLDQQHTSALEPAPASVQLNSMTTTAPRGTITGDDLLEALDLTEAVALSDPGQRALWGLIAKGSINASAGSNTRAILTTLFPVGSTTRDNLIAFVTTPLTISLLASVGLPSSVYGYDIETARARYGG